MGTKAVRFSDHEEKAIKEFLDKNPAFDFSTLARIAIINFIEEPNIKDEKNTVKGAVRVTERGTKCNTR